ASLNQPGGNATGVAFFSGELVGKHFELLHELLPKATIIGLLVNPTNPSTDSHLRDIPAASQTLGLKIVVQRASSDRDLGSAFAAFVQQGVAGLAIPPDPFFLEHREQLAELAARNMLPAIYSDRVFVADGGLISYGTSLTDAYRQAGIFTGRILKGD